MKFKIRVCTETNQDGWWEEYDENVEDAQKWAEETVARFNATIRNPKEQPRTLLAVEVIEADTTPKHAWVKTNNFTLQDRQGRLYDTVKCTTCGITGKRYGLGRFSIIRDSKFKAKVYEHCDTTQAHLKRLEERRLTRKPTDE